MLFNKRFHLILTPKFISKRYHRRNYKKPQKKELRRNQNITASEVFVIDDEGSRGVLSLREALNLAREKELDLVEVSPKAEPPVCKIMDYGQHTYKQEKNERKHKARQKKLDVKGIRLSLRMSENDRDTRRKQAEKFLTKKHKLKIEMNLRGRERQHVQLAEEIIKTFVDSLPETTVDQAISRQGGRLTTTLLPK